jgi:hypothetical protein
LTTDDIISVADSPQIKDLVGSDIVVFWTGETMTDENYVDKATGEYSTGLVCHLIAKQPDGSIVQSDPGFPSVIWQSVLKRKIQQYAGKWTAFRLEERKSGNGFPVYLARAIKDEETLDLLFAAKTDYMNDNGLSQGELAAPPATTTVKQLTAEEAPF